jgi:pimeloyl-ACP methyl ester carboxylesterase
MHIVVDGILTSYERVGTGKKTLLILHGWQRSLQEWLPVAHNFAEEYTIILLDLPGFGNTPHPDSTFSIYDYATFVEHFLEKLGMKHVTLVGHSFGGRIGIVLAAKHNILEKLILVDSAAVEKKSLFIQTRIVLNKLAVLPFKLLFPSSVEKLKNRFGSDDYQAADNMRDIFIKTVNEDLSPLLKKIDVPTFVIWGEKDTIRPITEGKFIKKNIPGAKLRVVWGAGHSPYLEKRKDFIEIVQEML